MERFYNEAEDVQWLFETHLKDASQTVKKITKSFVLEGNEDCPTRIVLYLAVDPIHHYTVFVLNAEREYTQEF